MASAPFSRGFHARPLHLLPCATSPRSLLPRKATAPRWAPVASSGACSQRYGIALPRGSTLLGPVDKALAALIADGTVERLQRKWIKVHLDDVKELR